MAEVVGVMWWEGNEVSRNSCLWGC
jgi:hypothetical protein